MPPTFDITERLLGDVAVLAVAGDVTPGKIEGVLSKRVLALIDRGYRKLVLNMEGLPSIDSIGLGEIVRCYTSATRQGARLKLAAVPRKILDLLRITRLIMAFEVLQTEDEAVRSFTSSAT